MRNQNLAKIDKMPEHMVSETRNLVIPYNSVGYYFWTREIFHSASTIKEK